MLTSDIIRLKDIYRSIPFDPALKLPRKQAQLMKELVDTFSDIVFQDELELANVYKGYLYPTAQKKFDELRSKFSVK